MANYELVIGSKFQPFSYERYIKPYQLYNEAYTKQEEALDTLSVQTETLRQRALTEQQNGNNKWAQRYLDYADSLQRQAEALSREGLNINSRKALSSLKKQYGDTVVPVQKAVEAQAALAKIAASQNPALRMQYGAMPTIDELIADPTKTQIGYSGAAVEESAAKLAAQAASRTTSDSFNAFRHYWMRHLQTVGYNQATINKFLDEAKNVPELQKIFKQVSDQFGGFEGLSEIQKDKMKGEILTGILKGAGYKESVNYQQNPVALEYLRHSHAMEERGNNQSTSGFALNPSNIYSIRERNEINDNIKNYSQFFTRDANGIIQMTDKGRKEYNRKIKRTTGTPQTTPEGTTILTDVGTEYIPSPFRRFMDSLGANKYVVNGKIQPGNMGNLWAKYLNDNQGSTYDTMKLTEYIEDLPASEDYQKILKGKISRALGSVKGLDEIDFNSKTGTWERLGSLSKDKLMSSDYTIVSRAPSELGMQESPNIPVTSLLIKDKEGNIKRYIAPRGIHSSAESGRDAAIVGKLYIQRRLYNDKTLTAEEREKLEKLYDNLNQQQLMFDMQLDYTNKTKDQTLDPYYVP